MLTVYTDRHRLRDVKTELAGGQLVPPYECPARAEYVLARVEEVALGEVVEPRYFDPGALLRIHDPDFVRFLETCWAEWKEAGFEGEAIPTVWPSRGMQQRVPAFVEGRLGYYAMAAETSIGDGTWEAARASANVALTAQAHVAEGNPAAFALCRPPGHHAAADLFGGYCFLNNAAIAAQAFLDQGAERVAILDVDFHHGNGTQAIFYDRPDVLFVSLHGDPRDAFPHFLGYADEWGTGKGEGFNVNYPLPPGTDYARWAGALADGIERIERFGPDALVVSLGVDTFKDDPISFFRLDSPDFSDCGARIAALRRPTLFIMEGGYAVDAIGVNAVNVLTGFEGA